MKHKFVPIVFFLAFLMSCGQPQDTAHIIPDWTGWKRTTFVELDQPIPGHADNYRRIYINKIGESLQVQQQNSLDYYNYPAGTIIAKEIYQGINPPQGSKPMTITAMVKAPDDPRSQGGWLWVVKDVATGNETVLGSEFCITCHANANERHPYGDGNPLEEFRDYLFFPYDSRNPPSAPN